MRAIAVCLLLLTVAAPATAESRRDREAFFELKIRPVLAGTCLRCHDARKSRGGLRLDSRAALLRGGKRGPALVPGHPEQSLLLHALKHDSQTDIAMPPGRTLSANIVADFSRWIQDGAVWPANHSLHLDRSTTTRHWAFQPVHKYVPPPDPSGWSANSIDCFIASGHRRHGVHPAARADRRTLLRRIYFDLIGLPPTPAEIHAFLIDPAPDAYARVVDRLLASPQYGERWGRHWMDLVRYADTAGDNADYPVPEAYLYRDYIIAAFNSDKPYDQFLTEQLAGDILARHGSRKHYAEQVIATTYLALSRRYLTAPYEQWHLTLEDTIDTTGRAFLGLTLRCARCHDHKFDPVTQRDYYALYGIFASTQFPYGGSEEFASMNRPRQYLVPLLPPTEADPRLEAHRKKLAELGKSIDRLEKTDPLAQRLQAVSKIIAIETQLLHDLQQQHQPADDVKAALARYAMQTKTWRSQLDGKIEPLRAERRRLERSNLPPDVPGAYAVADGKPADVPLQRAGDPDRPGPIVPRRTPAFLTRKPNRIPADSSGRLELARWLTDPANPLTARVMVNRIWQYHFGNGLVATPSDFGTRGTPPTHPELLDWLAVRFMESGWSIKAMHRLILLSRTYQLTSTADDANLARDPANTWYWRYDRRRLDAEALRDAMLAVSGRLDLRRPGPQPFPPITAWRWTQHMPFKDIYPSNCRTVFLMTQRLQRHPFLALFDGPDTNVTTATRTRSTVPLQALFLMNNPFVADQARGFAERILRARSDLAGRLTFAYELAWGRLPASEECNAAQLYLTRYHDELVRLGVPSAEREVAAWTSLAKVLLSANEFFYVE